MGSAVMASFWKVLAWTSTSSSSLRSFSTGSSSSSSSRLWKRERTMKRRRDREEDKVGRKHTRPEVSVNLVDSEATRTGCKRNTVFSHTNSGDFKKISEVASRQRNQRVLAALISFPCRLDLEDNHPATLLHNVFKGKKFLPPI